ncbi:EamA family transporter [Mucilaginibacter aquatilis]|uniref:EamA family transporter n=1 Tax=Mucilaginibacter aquatilis TaxID=1517760 RepID=A0A6I4IBK1_9SPHI|nr:EamA family transporter [Mucilaginibacter aquatilis]MVN91308.1 EamA family transporter [Mucilaginibacter aquatilis]
MLYILLSVCCSVTVSILLKLARRYQINVAQAITWNYSIAALLTWIFLKPQPDSITHPPLNLYLLLGVLLPLIFYVMAAAIKGAGIVRTDVAQRLSLLISLSAAFLIFGDSFSVIKGIGILTGFAAIFCLIPWQTKHVVSQNNKNTWLYLIGVFLGFGIIDILFKQMAQTKTAPYSASLFVVYVAAFLVSVLGTIYQVTIKKKRFLFRHIFFGWILGVFNFGNILFYLKAHQALAKDPSTVFTAMNIGVITGGTLIGLLIFKEKLSTLHKVGVGLAVAAILLIAYS